MVGELILLAFERAKDTPLNNHSVRASILARLKHKIQARLTDPDLQLSDVASECGISLSFELASVSGSTVTDVALACGFSNLSHFSTAFKGAFSVSPREVLHALRRDKTNS
jgi:AraC-like DNA-binding protein